MTLDTLVDVLLAAWTSARPPCSRETDLQDAIERVFRAEFFVYTREHRLGPKDRIDFLVAGGLGVEVKVDGGLSPLTRQLFRYAEHPAITGLIVVTTRNLHRRLPELVLDKPLRLCCLSDFLL